MFGERKKAATHGGEAGNLVAQPLGLDDGHLGADALVAVEILGEAPIVLLDDDARGLLDGLRAYATLRDTQGATQRSQPQTRGCGFPTSL